MRGCVKAVLVLLLSFPIFAQCNYSLGYSGPFRASYLDLAIDGNDLWAATSYGVQLFDRSVDPPALAASVAVPGITRVVRVANGMAYAASGTRIYAIRKNGKSIAIAGSADAGATINDILATPLDLYVGTTNGLRQWDLLNPNTPTLTNAVFLTSGANVTSLALSGSSLYVVDGDSSIEVFSIIAPTSPQKNGTFETMPRPTSIKSSGSRLYVSDGTNTDVFLTASTGTKAATVTLGTTSLATLGPDIVFAAGSDRRYRALDWTLAQTPVELFANDIVPTGGTVNRIGTIQVAGNRVYVAGGDAGLLTYDIASFTAPFPIRSYPGGATTSAAWVDGKLYVSRAAGGISEYVKNAAGTLTAARQWDAHVQLVHDGANAFLLTSSGATLYFWTLGSTIPVLIASTTFRANIVSASLTGFTAYAVLSDRSLWSADVSQTTPVPQAIAISGFSPSFIARSGNAIALSDLHDDGTTTVAFFPAHDFSSAAQTMSVAGSASGGIALSGSTAAVFTFLGINLLNFSSGTASVIPQSNTSLVRRLAFNGGSLFALSDDALAVWDVATAKQTRKLALPAPGSALAVDTIAAVPIDTGVIGVAYNAASSIPALLSTRAGNSYYRKALASGDRLYLFDGRGVDVFETRFGFAPHLIASARPAGIVDFAISPSNLFTVTGGNVVGAWSRDGVPLAQATLNEGVDVQPNRLSSAGGALWVSISRGCFTGSCEKKTLVLDPKTLVRTAILDGDAVEVAESAGHAYALFDLPAEIRAYTLGDPLHPSLAATVAAEGSKTPVSIAVDGNVVYVDGEKLYTYTTASLAKIGEQFDAYQPDLTNTLQYVDQRVRADAGCVLVSARTFSPQFTAAPQPLQVPAVVKSLAAVPGRFYVLTDDSLEVWSSQAAVPSPRHRAAR
jgi:hypothetical protein